MSTSHLPAVAGLLLALAGAGYAHGGGAAARQDACAVARNSAEGAAMRLPFETVNGRIYVDAHVNGQGPFTFAIDTGASGLGRADASLVAELGLAVTGTDQSSDGVNTQTVNTVHLSRLALGGLVREDFDVITRDYSANLADDAKIAGIIARDFFVDGLLVIDFPARTLWFTRADELTAEQHGALAYERPFRIPVSIADRVTTGNLDTGASVTMVLPRSLYDEVAEGPLVPAGSGRLTNTTIETLSGVLPGPVRIGDASFSNVTVRVSGRYPELLIGGQVLQDYVVAIDQRTQLVALCRPQG